MTLPNENHRLSFPGLKDVYGYVTVEGHPLEVYGVKEEGDKTIAYIEAMEGKEFKVAFQDGRIAPQVHDPHVVRIFLDGTKVFGVVVETKADKFAAPMESSTRLQVVDGAQVSRTSIQPFIFAKLATTDIDENACNDEAVVRGMGTISLRYFRVKTVRPTDEATFPEIQQQQLHEKSKKATLSHQASFGPPVVRAQVSRSSFDWLDPEDAPFAVVEFRYRSRALLHLEEIIPDSPAASPVASPSPSPLPAPVPQAASLSPVAGPSNPRRSSSAAVDPAASAEASRLSQLEAQLEELKRAHQIAKLEREIAALRGGGGGGSGSGSPASASQAQKRGATADGKERDLDALKRVKREEGEKLERKKAKNRRKGKEPEVIDLLDDSD